MATTDLGKWMITNGGNYDPEATYEQLTMVMYDNSTYITLKTVTGVTPTNDGVNYILMAKGFDATALSAVTATDTSGLLGDPGETVTAQSLVDYLADAVATKLLKKADISTVQSSSITTVPASALLKATDDKIGDTSSLPGESSNVVSAITQLNSDMQNHFPPGLIWQTNSSNTYRYGFGSGSDGYMYIDNQNLSTKETTRLQFSKNGALDLLTINDGDLNYIGHFISDADFATGTTRIQTTNGEASTSQVSFGKTFSSTPKVFCNIKTSVPSNKWINAGNISTTGFTIYADVDVTGTITVDWFAVAI